MGTLYVDTGGTATNSGSSDNNAADLEGASLATLVADTTFTTISVANQVPITGHGYSAGTGIILTTSGTLPTGLATLTMYFVGVISADIISLHTNVADAEAGTSAVAITNGTGSGTHTVNNYTLNLGEAINLSAVPTYHARVTTTGTSHVFTTLGGIHGIATADPVQITTSVTIPTGLTAGNVYYANALSTTTFRLYTTAALATGGGASDINVSAAGAGTHTVTHSATGAIYIDQASNSNKKIFWVRAVSDTNNLVVVDTKITLSSSPTDWRIGGRNTVVDTALSVCRAGDRCVVNNSPASVAGTVATFRIAGDTTLGHVKLVGKTGTKPVLTTSTTANCVSTSFARSWIENLEIIQQGATGSGITAATNAGDNGVVVDVIVSDAGSGGCFSIPDGCTGWSFDRITFYGSAGPGMSWGDAAPYYIGNAYIYGNATHGITGRGTQITIQNSIITANSGNGILKSTTGSSWFLVLINVIIWKNLGSGIEDANNVGNQLLMRSCIVADNGNAAGEYNIEWINTHSQVCAAFNPGFNCIAQSGGSAGNVFNYSLGSADTSTAPDMVDPDNATASLRNFGINSSSPCKATGAMGTWLGLSGTTGYMDMGAVQRQEPAGGAGGLMTHPGMSGGMRG